MVNTASNHKGQAHNLNMLSIVFCLADQRIILVSNNFSELQKTDKCWLSVILSFNGQRFYWDWPPFQTFEKLGMTILKWLGGKRPILPHKLTLTNLDRTNRIGFNAKRDGSIAFFILLVHCCFLSFRQFWTSPIYIHVTTLTLTTTLLLLRPSNQWSQIQKQKIFFSSN